MPYHAEKCICVIPLELNTGSREARFSHEFRRKVVTHRRQACSSILTGWKCAACNLLKRRSYRFCNYICCLCGAIKRSTEVTLTAKSISGSPLRSSCLALKQRPYRFLKSCTRSFIRYLSRIPPGHICYVAAQSIALFTKGAVIMRGMKAAKQQVVVVVTSETV